MRSQGLQGKTKRKFKSTTDSKHKFPIAENKLERNFTAAKPDQKWLADITYLPTLEGYLFLAVILDVFSRKIVGWSIHDSLEAKIVLDALEMARLSRRPGAGLLHHSDRGSQYASNALLRDPVKYFWRLERCERAKRVGVQAVWLSV